VPLALDYPTGTSPLYWRQTPAGQVVMGGGRSYDHAGTGSYDRGNTPEIVRFFAAGIAALMPALRGLTVARIWAGTMGFTPDGRPIVGRSSLVDGFVMAQACNGSGLPWVPLVGRLVAEAVTGAPPSLPLAPLSPDRFAALQG
jgi:sarcosine oxidase subunit beta